VDTPGSLTAEVTINTVTLNPGVYHLEALLMCSNMTKHFDWIKNDKSLTVTGARPATAAQQFQAEWKIHTA